MEQPEVAALKTQQKQKQRQDQKIAAFGSSYAPVEAAEGCDLLLSGAPLLCSHTLSQSFWIRFLALYDFSS
ncbi:hypothetical protein F6R97_17430 [Pseudomonas sp. JV414]|uniref:hypothetical protein n=1 Tax=Pseudomonas TaxID=286 RepID=UPI0012E2A593|nr:MULTISPECIES: hypothetical protein [Pseudomonas]MDT9676349.1 hypothetical protein [Pseudomonas sp. JV414]